MNMEKLKLKLLQLILALFMIEGYRTQDPCTSAKVLGSLKQRLVGYKLTVGESPLCDYYMSSGWYNMGTSVLATTAEPCGTTFNWFMNDFCRYTTTRQPDKTVDVCRMGNDCSVTKKTYVKKCEDDTFVFLLTPTDGCPEAYCIDSPPDISSVNPTVSAVVTRPDKTNLLNFFCNFTPPQSTDLFYVVEWGITTGLSWITTIKRFEPEKYTSATEFSKMTALTEQMLTDKNYGRLGITLSCVVTAQNTLIGASSTPRESPPKFFGIEVQNKAVRVNNKEETVIYLRLTAPFGCDEKQNGTCSIDLNVYIPKDEDKDTCRLTNAAQVGGVRNRCGLYILNTKINKWIPLRLTSFDGETRLQTRTSFNLLLSTHKTVPIHPFFGNYYLDPIKVEVLTDMRLLQNKLCHSNNDPHMCSFDGLRYENQNSGRFLLYRNTKYNVQVQIETSECRHNIWCNCGVAISAGRDVFIINSCGLGWKWDIRFRECNDRILRRKVKMVHSTHYQVYLPTGSVVTIRIRGYLLNVNIAPGLADFESTEGLCGLFDLDKSNDRARRPNSNENDPNISWRVTKQEDLFNEANDKLLKPWQEEKLLCTCNADTSSIVDLITCHPDQSKSCTDDRKYLPVFEDQCSLAIRKKRNTHGVYVDKMMDRHRNVETNFMSKSSVPHSDYLLKQVQKRTVYDMESARADCLEIFNTTAYIKCTNIPGIDYTAFLENCILDAQITNTMEWSLTHLEALKDKCIYEVAVNQPLSAEELESVSIILNNTIVNGNMTSNEISNMPDIQEILDVSCPNECNGNGQCNEGSCHCESPFIGDDCSIDSTLPPVMEGIPDHGECDLQFRACEQTSVFASNIAESPHISCHLIPFAINSKFESVSNGNALTVEGDMHTFVEVKCPLQNARTKRSSETSDMDYVAYGYAVSISNDGVLYSEEDIIVIFDSECVHCTKDNGVVICRINPGYCVKNGQCYKYGEKYGCNVCAGDIDNLLQWKPGSDCPIPIVSPDQQKKLWIIAAVGIPVVVIILVVLAIFYYQSKRVRSKTADCSMYSIYERNKKSAY